MIALDCGYSLGLEKKGKEKKNAHSHSMGCLYAKAFLKEGVLRAKSQLLFRLPVITKA